MINEYFIDRALDELDCLPNDNAAIVLVVHQTKTAVIKSNREREGVMGLLRWTIRQMEQGKL